MSAIFLQELFCSFVWVAVVSPESEQPRENACKGKQPGTACTVPDEKKSGSCIAATCTDLDYSQGSPPRSVDRACVLCDTGQARQPERKGAPSATAPQLGAPSQPASSRDAPASASTSPSTAGAPASGADPEQPVAPGSAAAATPPAPSSAATPATPPKVDPPRGCCMVDEPRSAWWTAVLLPLTFLRLRRRVSRTSSR